MCFYHPLFKSDLMFFWGRYEYSPKICDIPKNGLRTHKFCGSVPGCTWWFPILLVRHVMAREILTLFFADNLRMFIMKVPCQKHGRNIPQESVDLHDSTFVKAKKHLDGEFSSNFISPCSCWSIPIHVPSMLWIQTLTRRLNQRFLWWILILSKYASHRSKPSPNYGKLMIETLLAYFCIHPPPSLLRYRLKPMVKVFMRSTSQSFKPFKPIYPTI